MKRSTPASALRLLILLPVALLLAGPAAAQTTRSDSVLEPGRSLDVGLDAWETARQREPLPSGGWSEKLRFAHEIDLEGDISLTGIWSAHYLTFTIPETWVLDAPPVLHLDVMRSAQLIPEISAITAWVDEQPVGTFNLDGEPGTIWQEEMILPLAGRKTVHTLQFNAYHRSWMPCELADHPGLWSRLMASSTLEVQYREVAPERSLARWPYPFVDDADPHPSRVVLLLPALPSEEELLAAGYIASALGQRSGDRKLDLRVHLGNPADAPEGHLIAIYSGDRPDSLGEGIAALAAADPEPQVQALAPRLVGGQEGGAGILALFPRPDDPLRVLLAVVGRDGRGLLDLARLLSSEPADSLPAGPAEAIAEVPAVEPMEARRWEETMPPEPTFSLQDLGLGELTAVGFRGGSVFIPLRRVPDDVPVAQAAHLSLVYSHAGQVSPANSRLDVLIGGIAVGGVALDRLEGATRQRLELDLPAHDLAPDTLLEVRFELVGREAPICLGETQDPLWGTVHADSRFEIARARVPRLNDLSLLRHGGYPFGIRPDLSETLVILPALPTAQDVQLLAWVAAELGRVARGNRFAYGLRLGGLRGDEDRDRDLVVIDTAPPGKLIQALGLFDRMWFAHGDGDEVAVSLASRGKVAWVPDAGVAFLEQLALPWREERGGLVIFAPSADLFERVGPCGTAPPLFERLGGRVTRIAACDDVVQVPLTEDLIQGRRPVGPDPQAQAEQQRVLHRRVLLGALGLLLVLGGVLAWRARQLRQREVREADL